MHSSEHLESYKTPANGSLDFPWYRAVSSNSRSALVAVFMRRPNKPEESLDKRTEGRYSSLVSHFERFE